MLPRMSEAIIGATPPSVTPASLRDMAARARRLALAITDNVTASRLTEYAEELETQAAALDTATAARA
jgi:hypothetical protein